MYGRCHQAVNFFVFQGFNRRHQRLNCVGPAGIRKLSWVDGNLLFLAIKQINLFVEGPGKVFNMLVIERGVRDGFAVEINQFIGGK